MASTELKRTISSAGSQTKWGASAWVKRCDLGLSAGIYCSSKSDTTQNNRGIFFNADDKIECAFYNSGYTYQVVTNRKFRDVSAWYHVVVNLDTSQSTAADRIKIWVNGVQETSFATSNYPSQNSTHNFLGTDITQLVGSLREGSSIHHSCVISHLHFTDGYCYPASSFGETDSTTGEWKIKTDVTGVTYGTNGFWWLKDSIATTDHSPNSNTFTVSAGTLTKTEDNPSNVFCTLNPLYRSNVSSQNNIGFNHGNTTWFPSSASNTHSWGRSTLGWTSGKYYMEFKIEEAGGGQASGVWMVPTELPNSTSPQSTSNTAYGWQVQFSGSDQNLYTTNGGSTVATITTSVGSNPIVMMAIDADNNKMWVGHNGTWYNNNNASTTLNTSYPDHTWTPGTYGDMYQLAFQAYYSSGAYNNAYGNFGNGYFGTTAVATNSGNGYAGAEGSSIFNYQPPTGYSALSTKGLNQ